MMICPRERSQIGYSASNSYNGKSKCLTRTVNSVTENYTYDNADKLQDAKVAGVTQKSYGYDSAGRTTSVVSSAGTTTLAYDYEGRINQITYPSTATNTFTYNGLDTRVGKVDSAGTATYKRDGAGVTAPVLNDGGATYTPGISERRSTTTTFLHSGLKNADSQTGTGQSIAATKQYDAFGNVLSSTGTWKGPFGYAGSLGYQEDADSSLKLLGHRYYDASTGRFLTRDPIEDGRNWYSYCAGNPLTWTDPEGLQTGWGRERAQAVAEYLALEYLKEKARDVDAQISKRKKIRDAKRIAGIPVTQHPKRQGKSDKLGTQWWEYEVEYREKYGFTYKDTVIIVAHDDGSVHVGRPRSDSPHNAKGGRATLQ